MATRTPRAVKAPVAVEEVTDEASNDTGLLTFTSSETKVDRVPIFTIDDVEYTVPAKPKSNVGLRFLNALRVHKNETMAALQLVEDMLGKDAFDKFLSWEDFDDDVFAQVLDICIVLATAQEETTGK